MTLPINWRSEMAVSHTLVNWWATTTCSYHTCSYLFCFHSPDIGHWKTCHWVTGCQSFPSHWFVSWTSLLLWTGREQRHKDRRTACADICRDIDFTLQRPLPCVRVVQWSSPPVDMSGRRLVEVCGQCTGDAKMTKSQCCHSVFTTACCHSAPRHSEELVSTSTVSGPGNNLCAYTPFV